MNNHSFERNLDIQNETIEHSLASNISHEEASAIYEGILGLAIMVAMAAVGFRFLYLKSPFHLDKVKPIKPNLFQKLAQANCKKCRFYNRRAEVKCAVHPVRVNFAEAQTCPDYWQRDRRKFLYR